MRESKQYKLTKKFFDDVAHEWYERTYDPRKLFAKFPVNGARRDTAFTEISKLLPHGGRTMDLGCGTGQLVIDLLKAGYTAEGIDIAPQMIAEARKHFRAENRKENPDAIFTIGDFRDVRKKGSYDTVTALGLLEYLDNERELFRTLKKTVRTDGFALVECRNALFGLFTANAYTEALLKGSSARKQIAALNDVDRFSPLSFEKVPEIYAAVSARMAEFLAKAAKDSLWKKESRARFTPFPKGMMRTAQTPQELEVMGSEYGFTLDYVVYYHFHPFLPKYEKLFPRIFNKLSLLMAPLGQTPLGASTASAFIGILRRRT